MRARLRRQVLNLEDDELPHHARRHIAGRIAELEDELAGYQPSLARIQQQPVAARPDALTVRELLATFPVKGVELRKLGQPALRELLASLNLLVRYDHTRHTVRLHLTLTRGQGEGFLECGSLRRHETDQIPEFTPAWLTTEIALPPKARRDH